MTMSSISKDYIKNTQSGMFLRKSPPVRFKKNKNYFYVILNLEIIYNFYVP